MREIAAGNLHRREIEDSLGLSEQQTIRAIDKLAWAGCVRVKPARDPGRGGKSARLYRCHPTETGFLMLELCQKIVRHRQII